jgi:hypothetical protein
VLQLDPLGESAGGAASAAGTDWGSAVAAGPDGTGLRDGLRRRGLRRFRRGQRLPDPVRCRGHELWRLQFGTAPDEYGLGVVADPVGNAFVTWATSGEVGPVNERAFVSKFDADGDERWTRKFDERYPLGAMAVDAEGRVSVTGRTDSGVVVVTFDRNGNEVGRRFFDLDDVVARRAAARRRARLPHRRHDARYCGRVRRARDGVPCGRRAEPGGGSSGTSGSDEGRSLAVDDAGHVLMVGATAVPATSTPSAWRLPGQARPGRSGAVAATLRNHARRARLGQRGRVRSGRCAGRGRRDPWDPRCPSQPDSDAGTIPTTTS